MPENRETMKTGVARLWGGLRRLASYMPSPVILFFVALIAWILSGVFVIGPDEVGLVKTFGRNARTEEQGLHYHLPWPISTVLKPKVGRIYRMAFEGEAKTVEEPAPTETDEDAQVLKPGPSGLLMLSGDENLVDVRFSLQYQISNEEKYLFHLAEPEKTIRSAAEAAMRSVVGRTRIEDILTTGKQTVVDEVKVDLQGILDRYNAGVKIVAVQLQAADPPIEVWEAFKAVVSAQEKVNRLVNEAEGYANEAIPEARGRAVAIARAAEAYHEERIKKAEGEAVRFLALLEESRKAGDVTRVRLYLETMERVLSQAGSLILEPKEKNVMPFLWNMQNSKPPKVPGPDGDSRQ